MAIAFNSSGDIPSNTGGTVNPYTVAYTLGTGSNLLVVIFSGDLTSGNDDVTSVTYAGANMALAAKITNTSWPNRFSYFYYLQNPASGTNNIVITCTNTHYIFGCVADYTGANGGFDAVHQADSGASTSSSLANSVTTIADNCWVIMGAYQDSNALTTTQTLRVTSSSFGNPMILDSNGPVHPAGSYDATIGTVSPVHLGTIAVSFSPSAIQTIFYEEMPHRTQDRRRVHLNFTDPNEFIRNPTQTVFASWGGIEESPHRFQTRRNIKINITDPNEFIRNPTQTVFAPWGGIEESPHRFQDRRTTKINITDPNEFIRNPTQVVFQPWGFEEEPHRAQDTRRIRLPQTAPDEFLRNPTQTAFQPWGFEEENHRVERRPAQLKQTSPDEFIRNPTQAVFAPWSFEEENHRIERRPVNLHQTAPDEFILNPTQTVFAKWGFEEEAHREQRRPLQLHQTAPDEFIKNPTQSVFVFWGFDEENHRIERRPVQLKQTAPDEFINNPSQAVFAAWGFEEENHRLQRLRVQLHQTAPDEFIRNPTQAAFALWGFDEENHRLQRRLWLAFPKPADNEGLPFTAAVPTAYFEEEAHRLQRRRLWLALAEANEFIFNPTQAVFRPWGFEEEAHRLERRRTWLALAEPNEFLLNPAQAVFVPWGFEEEAHRLERRLVHLNLTDPNEFLLNPSQTVFVAWALDEAERRLERTPFHARPPQPDDPGFTPEILIAPWGWEEASLRLQAGRAIRLRAEDVEGLPFTTAAPTLWFDDERSRHLLPAYYPRNMPDELLPISIPIIPVFDDRSRPVPAVFHRLAQDYAEWLPFTAAGPRPFVEDAFRSALPPARLRRIEVAEFLSGPSVLPPSWGWEDRLGPRVRIIRRGRPAGADELLPSFAPALIVPQGWEGERLIQVRRALFRTIVPPDDTFRVFPPIPYGSLELTAPEFILDLGSVLGDILIDHIVSARQITAGFTGIKVIVAGVSTSPISGKAQAISGEIQVSRIPAIIRFTCRGSDGRPIIIDGIYMGAFKPFFA